MKAKFFAGWAGAGAVLWMVGGCAGTNAGLEPSNFSAGGGDKMRTGIVSPQPNQVFSSGQDIAIEAVADDLSGVEQVAILVNGKQLGVDKTPPYQAVLAKAVPGQYAIQSYATNRFGDNKLSTSVFITVR